MPSPSSPSFSLFLPPRNALIAPRFIAPDPTPFVSDHHNLSFLYGMYGQTLATGGERENALVMEVDSTLASAFPFLEPFANKLNLAMSTDNVITLDKDDNLGPYEVLSIKVTLLKALRCYWMRYMYMHDGKQCKGRTRKARRITGNLQAVEQMLCGGEYYESLLIPIATLTTSLIDLSLSSEAEITYALTHATYMLGPDHLDDLTKLRDRDERVPNEGSSLAGNANADDLIEGGKEAAAVRYGDVDIFCHERANQVAILRFLIKHSALFEYISEFAPTYYNDHSIIMGLDEASRFSVCSPVASHYDQMQMLNEQEAARRAAESALQAISLKQSNINK